VRLHRLIKVIDIVGRASDPTVGRARNNSPESESPQPGGSNTTLRPTSAVLNSDMSGRVSRLPRPAFCEDYNDDTNTTLPGTRRSANVAAKRSKPELPKVKPTESADGASDSGYSSRTAATVGSGDSAQSGKKSPPVLRVDTRRNSSKERTSRAQVTERKPDSTQRGSSRPDPQRSPSKSRKRESLRHDQVFHDQRGRPVMTPLETLWRVDYPPFSYPPTPAYDTSRIPPTPQSARYPPPPMWPQEIQAAPTATPRPRIPSSQSYHRQARPMTIHGGIMQEMMYMAMPQQPQYDHGPPPSASAYANVPFSFPPSTPVYTPAPIPQPQRGRSETQPPPSPYHEPRPRHQTEQPPTNRRASMYGPPVVDYVHGGQPAERRWSIHRDQRPPPPPRSQEKDEDYYRMPPPLQPQVIPLKKRPSVRKSASSNPVPTIRRSSKDYDDTRAQVADRNEPEPARRRPSLELNPGRKATLYTNGQSSVKVATAGVLNHSKTYHGRQDLEQKQREVEDYQEAKGGRPVPLTADSLKHVRRSHKSGSESGSQSRTSSSRSVSDVKTKSGTVSRGESDSFTMTVNGVKLGFSSEAMEGKTINLRKKGGENGTMDIQIGGKGGKHYIVSKDEVIRRREIDDGRRTRDESRTDQASRRTSRSGNSDRGSVK
jgi:hypothetical protein